MRRTLCPAACLLFIAGAPLWGAWTIEAIPTTIDIISTQQYLGFLHPGSEFASAYSPIYDANGVKTGENMVLAYRSGKLRIDTMSGTSWTTMTFADDGRYPSVALDSQGKPHMSFYRSTTKKIYYAHPVQPGLGNCGAQLSYACEQLPGNLWGDPAGRSAIAITGTTVHIVYEALYQPGLQKVFYYTKPVNNPNWIGPLDASAGYGVKDLALRSDANGGIHMLIVDSDSTQWYKLNGSGWTSAGPVWGYGSMAITSGGLPRLCYRDPASNQLIYATSNGDGYTPVTLDYDAGSLGVCDIAIPGPNGIQMVGYYSPRIAYFDSLGGVIRYATPPMGGISGASWTVENVSVITGVKRVTLALDKSAKPVIVFYDSAARTFRLARRQ